MNYVLDTNIIINILKNKPNLVLESVIEENLYITIFTLSELLFGAKEFGRTEEFKKISRIIEELEIQILDFDIDGAEKFAEIKNFCFSKEKRIEDFDLLIASIVLVNDFILITENKNYFKEIEGMNVL